MIAKFVTVSIYLALGLWVVIVPLVAKAARGQTSVVFRRPYISAVLLAALAVWVSWIDAAGNHKLLVGWIVVSSVAAFAVRRQWTQIAIGSLAGMAIASALPWWRHDLGFIQASHKEVVYYVLISIAALGLLARNFTADTVQLSVLLQRIAIIAFIPFALFLSFGTGIAENPNTQIAWWHHWGAYVGPAELMLSGGHIFRDFPVQYGLGPTVAIAASCGSNCWVAMYYIVGTATFLLSLLVLCTALSLGIRSRLALIVIPVVTVIACFFWTSYGPAFSSPILYPSVSGLRFTPVVALVAMLCLIEGKLAWEPRWQWIGHGLWAIGALWSPESLYAVSFVWWPYFCWRHVAGLEWKSVPLAFIKAVAKLMLVFTIVLVAFLAVYGLAYHDMPSAKAWLAYMLYPPGPLPINPRGPIWWYIGVLILGLATLFRTFKNSGDSPLFRRNFLVVLMGYAALSYCMGRSHDNNFLNLAPFAMLITIGAFGSSLPVSMRAVSAAMLASMVGWMAVLGWSIWRDDDRAGRLFEADPEKVTDTFAYTNPAMADRLKAMFASEKMSAGNPDDVARAIGEITKRSGEQVTVLDHGSIVVEGDPRKVWDAFHSTAIYVYLPQEWRTQFLISAAHRFNRSGWVIVDKTYDGAPWLQSYNAAYDLAGEEDFGTYHAYHFVPKSTAQ